MNCRRIHFENPESEEAVAVHRACFERCKRLLEEGQAFVLLAVDEEGNGRGEARITCKKEAVKLMAMTANAFSMLRREVERL